MRRSDHAKLSGVERVKGIEPSSSAWEAAALPLSYTRDMRSVSLSAEQRQAFCAEPEQFFCLYSEEYKDHRGVMPLHAR